MKNIKVSVITINFNSSKHTLNFVNSIIEKTPSSISLEIIIVDNCSNNDDLIQLKEGLKAFKSEIKLIISNINLGFGGGNMLGNQKATGNYLAFINNDIIFTEDCFTALINHHLQTPQCGVNTPQQYNRYLKPTSCFDYEHGIRKNIFGRKFIELTSKKVKRENRHYTENVTADFIQGCFMFFKTKAFNDVGGFDSNIFLYFEEMDICYRLKKHNYTSTLVPSTHFIHYHGESTKKNYLIKKELKLSQLYITRKNYNYFKYSVIRIFILLSVFFKSIQKPVYWNLVSIIIKGNYLENSLKQQQKIRSTQQ